MVHLGIGVGRQHYGDQLPWTEFSINCLHVTATVLMSLVPKSKHNTGCQLKYEYIGFVFRTRRFDFQNGPEKAQFARMFERKRYSHSMRLTSLAQVEMISFLANYC